MKDDPTRVPVPLRTPLEQAMAVARPYKTKMVDAELQDHWDTAAQAGNWMAAIWNVADGQVHQFVKTREFPLAELRIAGWMMLAEIQRRMMADDSSPVTARPWGCWWPLIEIGNVHLDALYIAKGGFSSVHRHNAKANVFLPVIGSLTIQTYEGPPTQPKPNTPTILRPTDEATTIPPRTAHQFLAQMEHTLVLEISLPQPGPLSRADIERWTEAGLDEN